MENLNNRSVQERAASVAKNVAGSSQGRRRNREEEPRLQTAEEIYADIFRKQREQEEAGQVPASVPEW